MIIKNIFSSQEKNEIFDLAKETWIQNPITDDKSALLDAYLDAVQNYLNAKGYKLEREFNSDD